jgi:ABC-type transport system involved in cytochrome c biogenesis permease subunit
LAYSTNTPLSEQAKLLNLFGELPALRSSPTEFLEKLTELQSGIRALAEPRGEYKKVEMEVSFYRGNYFVNSLVFFIFGFVLIAVSWILPKRRWISLAAVSPLIIGLVLLTIGITLRCIIRGRPPVSTLYETILFITATAVLAGLLIEWMNRYRIAVSVAAVLGVVGMFLANRYEVSQAIDTMPSLVAVLDTNFWLATHVTTISIGYAAGLLAASIAHIYIVGRLFGFGKNSPDFYKNIARLTYGVLCLGLFFSILGTLLGGVWANESWGRFWGWDPKENGALMICLWMLVVIHARLGRHIKDLGVCIGAVAGGIVVAFSWWGVNLLNVGLHTYGFTQGVWLSLMVFYGLEVLVMGLGFLVWVFRRPTSSC